MSYAAAATHLKLYQLSDLSPEVLNHRMQVCSSCQWRDGFSCTATDWPRYSLPFKSANSGNDCVLGRWSQPITQPKAGINIVMMTPGLGHGGAELCLLNIAQNLPPDFHITCVVTTPDPTQLPADMVRKMSRVATVLVYTHDDIKISDAMQAADVILTWGIGSIPCFTYGSKAPVIWVAHGACQWTNNLLMQALPHIHVLAGVSNITRRVFPDDLQKSVHILYNGSNIERITPKTGRDATRRAWGLTDDHAAIGYIGRFSPEKRPTAVIEAIPYLPENYKGIIIGDGWKKHLVEEAALAAPSGRIVMPGYSQHVGDPLSAIDVWVNVSPSEGFALSLIEAWMAGVPCVSTPVGAVPELQEKYGPLVYEVPIGCGPKTLARAIKRALSPAFKPIRDKARQLAWEEFTAVAMAWRWEKLLRSVVDRSVPYLRETVR